MTSPLEHRQEKDRSLRERARAVIPGGMYGHQNAGPLPAGYPQFMARGHRARVWDVDGNEYVDVLCSYGPVILGHHHPAVEAAAAAAASLGDCQNAPSELMVELAETMVATVAHADWAMFQKNGTDATTLCCTIARAATGRKLIAVATGAYHGAAPWCTPRTTGTTPEDRANLVQFTYNDIESVHRLAERTGGDLAGIVVSPFRHDAGFDQELVDRSFANGVREICDVVGAALILDDVRAGFRLHLGCSWEPIGVEPDLSAWSKAMANGYPIAAVVGNDTYRTAAESLFTTGSFWFAAVPMAAALATIEALASEGAVDHMVRMGEALRAGITRQAADVGLNVRQTGPAQMPYLSFDSDHAYELADIFCVTALRHGAFVHPRHNWFVSAAMTEDDLDVVLSATSKGFAAVRRHVSAR